MNPTVFVATNNEKDPGAIGRVSRLEIRKIPPSSSVIAVGTRWPCDAEMSTSRVIFPDLSILSNSPWFMPQKTAFNGSLNYLAEFLSLIVLPVAIKIGVYSSRFSPTVRPKSRSSVR